ncbi:hypothetical protein [Coleofasciculus sp. FACHB-1120]|uniref:hypothetical protein n=1 Tax=Coleofasciculus sp. FACHB-1120 TaxID=2692783 RepID=UPI00168987A6|nr:hypothetical protein [Coleofasciculus sp. FACHB-1120]MBD2741570.1 hypothetical protein [Coleofasciculus sp. FACHB-1120]
MSQDYTDQSNLVPSEYYHSLDSLKVTRESICINGKTIGWIETKLNPRTLAEIENAWIKGIRININDGKIWLDSERVHSVLRTDKASASKWVILLPDHFKVEIEKREYVNAVALAASLQHKMPLSRDDYHRAYREVSWEMLTALRRAPQVEKIYGLLRRDLDKALSKLKNKRIKDYKIVCDELTGETLRKYAEFSHIRSKDIYPEYALFIWNGLVVNKTTHGIITANNITNEDDLLELCDQNGWDTSWHREFIFYLENCKINYDGFFKDFML